MHRGTTLACAIALAVSVTAGGHLQAHHSLSGVFDSSRQVTIEGVVTTFQFVNPHPYLTLEVRERGGATRQWRLELDNRWELAEIGISGTTFKAGDRLLVTGSPSYSQSPAPGLYVRTLDRPSDGFGYEQVQSRPRLRPAQN